MKFVPCRVLTKQAKRKHTKSRIENNFNYCNSLKSHTCGVLVSLNMGVCRLHEEFVGHNLQVQLVACQRNDIL